MGSKARIAKEILPIILKDRKPNQWYVELFAGGMNTICEVDGKRIANDKNKYLIEMWKGLQTNRGYFNDIPKEIYDKARTDFNNSTNIYFDDFEIGWIGWMGSANGRFFDGGYSGKSKTKIGTIRDYIKEAIANIEKQLPKMKDVKMFSKDYKDFEFKQPCLFYLDIPYAGTKQYATSKDFNHNDFWNWCRTMKKKDHILFISEYSAPEDFKCVWRKEVKSSLSANGIIGGSKNSVEKLFTL